MFNAVDGNFGTGDVFPNANPSAALYFVISQVNGDAVKRDLHVFRSLALLWQIADLRELVSP